MWRFWRGSFSILEVQFGLRGIELNTIQDSEPTKGSSLLLVLVLLLSSVRAGACVFVFYSTYRVTDSRGCDRVEISATQ